MKYNRNRLYFNTIQTTNKLKHDVSCYIPVLCVLLGTIRVSEDSTNAVLESQ